MADNQKKMMSKKASVMRFVGIVCWFLALFILLDGKNKEKKEKLDEPQNPVVQQVDVDTESDDMTTVIMPSKK